MRNSNKDKNRNFNILKRRIENILKNKDDISGYFIDVSKCENIKGLDLNVIIHDVNAKVYKKIHNKKILLNEREFIEFTILNK